MQRTQTNYLESLRKDLEVYKPFIKEAAGEMILRDETQKPVFIAHQHRSTLGKVLLDKDDYATEWTINASSAEELAERGVIQRDKVKLFMEKYKDPTTHMCLFVLVEQGGAFIYVPY